MEDWNARHCCKAYLMLRLHVEKLINLRCCCMQDVAAYRNVLYPNNYSEAPDGDTQAWDLAV